MSASESIKQRYIFRSKSAVSYNKERTQKSQKSDVVSFKATLVFSYIRTMLTTVLLGAQWIRDMEI